MTTRLHWDRGIPSAVTDVEFLSNKLTEIIYFEITSLYLPQRVQLNSFTLSFADFGNKRQMSNLCASPAKPEYHRKCSVIKKFHRIAATSTT